MSKFYKDVLSKDELEADNTLVTVKKSLKLIEGSPYYDELINLFKIDEQSTEPIPLPGLNSLINKIIRKDQQFEKIDYNINLCDVSLKEFTHTDSAILNLIIRDGESVDKLKLITAETAYNSKSDYFESAYKLDSFARFCQREKHVKLLKQNIEYLNEQYQNSNDFNRSFRLLKDSSGNYIRAITSTTHYNDYGIRFSLFVAIISFKNLMSAKQLNFKINRAEYDESSIKVFFEKNEVKNIKDVGQVRFIVELSNDEIKREAMKFSAVFIIKSNNEEIYIKPGRLKTELISIQHNFSPATVFNYLENLGEFIEKAEAEVIGDIVDFGKPKDFNELKYSLSRKVEFAKNEEIKGNKAAFKKLLENRISTLNELLALMGKIDMIVSTLEAKEYLRYMFYDVLKGKK